MNCLRSFFCAFFPSPRHRWNVIWTWGVSSSSSSTWVCRGVYKKEIPKHPLALLVRPPLTHSPFVGGWWCVGTDIDEGEIEVGGGEFACKSVFGLTKVIRHVKMKSWGRKSITWTRRRSWGRPIFIYLSTSGWWWWCPFTIDTETFTGGWTKGLAGNQNTTMSFVNQHPPMSDSAEEKLNLLTRL